MADFVDLRTHLVPGEMHGPGIVTVPAALRDAAASLGLAPPPAQRVLGKEPTAKRTAKATIDSETVRFLVMGLVSGDAEVQRYLVENYTLRDIEFVNILGSTRGQKDFYNSKAVPILIVSCDGFPDLYRLTTTFWDYHVTFRETIIEHLTSDADPERVKVAAWVDLKIRPAALPFMRRVPVTAIVIMHFAVDPTDGQLKMSYQVDHYSLFILTWCGGVLGQQLQEAIVRPLLGRGLAAWGHLCDAMQARVRPLAERWMPLAADGQKIGPDPPTLSDDARVRQAVSACSAAKGEVSDDNGWASHGVMGKTLQVAVAVAGLWTSVCMVALIQVTLLLFKTLVV